MKSETKITISKVRALFDYGHFIYTVDLEEYPDERKPIRFRRLEITERVFNTIKRSIEKTLTAHKTEIRKNARLAKQRKK